MKKFTSHRFLIKKRKNSLFASFTFASNGILYTFKNERNFKIHCLLGIIALIAAILLEINRTNLSILFLTIFSVLCLELLNTSIERTVDLYVGKKYSREAKIIKDCSAAAVLFASINSLFIAILILLPSLLSKL